MMDVLQSILNLPRDLASKPSGSFILRSLLDQDSTRADYYYSDIDLAIRGAGRAFGRKPGIGVTALAQSMVLITALLEKHREKIFEVAQSESGRTRLDLMQEWRQTLSYIESMGSWLQSDPLTNARARGIVAILGSSVWPIFYTLQFCLANVCAGNPVILKPSEKVSLAVSTIIQILRSELPVFESVQVLIGEREVGRRLACHEQVSLVIFQGTFEMGMRLRQDTSSQPGKEVLLYLGAKNFSVVYADRAEQAVEVLSRDCFQGAGQDCQSISLIWVERSQLEPFTQQMLDLARNFELGPLLENSLVDRYLKYVAISEREGAQLVLKGKSLKAERGGNFVLATLARFERLRPDELRKSVSLQTEILSPMVSIIGFDADDDLDLCLSQLNHGKLASVWSQDPHRVQQICSQMPAGRLARNQSVLDLDPWQTHQARRRSGNHARLGQGLIDQLMYPLV